MTLQRRVFLLAVLLLSSAVTGALAQVTAEFSAPVTSGCSPLIVNFQNQSTGTGLTYQWNLGNGNNSTAQNPSASYITPGTYTVTLTVTGPGGTDTEVKMAFITVFTPPNPEVEVSQGIGCFPFDVQFTDASIPGDAPVTAWSWDFGDGGASVAQNPTHTYTTQGTFNVTLLLTDGNGCTSNESFPGLINSNSNRPVAAFEASPLVGCIPPVNVNFTDQSSGGTGQLTYLWQFGDGNTSTTQNPTHSYETEGVYDVSLTVTDDIGCDDTEAFAGHITIVENPVIDFTPSLTVGCLGDQVQFSDMSFPPPTSWEWDFGDGNSSNQQNPSHLYTSPGTYTVTLTASYAGSCQATEVRTDLVSIGGIPFVAFTPSGTEACETPFVVDFTNNSVGASLNYLWDFGDGNTSTEQSPSHTYTENGIYTASLTATNPQGCSTTQSTTINVSETRADFLPDVFGFCLPLEVNFSDSSISASQIVSYQWDFGDGNTSTAQNPTHTYQDTGRYTITLIIENSLGCLDTLVRPNYIFAYTVPVADFDQTPQVICPGEFEFTNFSSGATDFFWDFGDEQTDVVENPIHTYQDTGYFSITLIALNNGCPDSVIVENMIYVSPPIARTDLEFSCSEPNTFTFTNNSIGDDSFFWTFEDGTTNSTDGTVTRVINDPGMYFIELTVFNDTSGCTDTRRDTVYVTELEAAFTQNITEGCAPLLVSFTNQSVDAVSYQWNFGGGASSATTLNPNRTFANIGTYTVRLVATDINGCLDTIIMPNLITATGALVDFAVDTAFGCDDLTVAFLDQTTPAGTIVSWLWEFGDGNTSTEQNPTHNYAEAGNYTVTLTTTDNAGCVNTRADADIVQSLPLAEPGFVANTQLGCAGDEFQFTNTSSAEAIGFLWDFGDGNTSSEQNPTHVYTSSGNYTVSLTVFNANGCDSTLTEVDYIMLGGPTADFTAFPTFAFCPPLLVSFTNQSVGALSYEWDFGNGNGSSIANPSHIYTQSGTFTVTLVVTNANGCTDTIVMPDLVTLAGPSGDFSFFPDTVGCPPYDITYQSNATNATQYTWDFGDGSLGTGATATHTYTETGAFIPTLILRDDNGCTFTFQSADTLRVEPLAVSAGNDVTICAGDEVQLGASGGDTYTWFPPIGLSSNQVGNPVASPSVTTQYVVTVQLLTCVNTDTVTVFVNPVPSAAFSTQNVCLGDTTFFNDNSTIIMPDSIVSWSWDLGGTFSNDTSPSIVFAEHGTFDISLEVVSNEGCSDTAISTVTVNPAPTAAFTANDTCLFNPTFFNDQSSVSSGSITTWQWQLGNGSTSLQPNPTATYSQDSIYSVTLIVTAEGGCTDTVTRTVSVFPLPQVDFAAENVCLGEPVLFFDSTTINTGGIAQWNWVFGDGNTSNEQNPSHLYGSSQAYAVSLSAVSDNGCTGTSNGIINVRPLPVSNFNMSSLQSCFVPASVNLLSQSQGATSLQWNLGNGQTSASANASAVYDSVGQYTITLVATTQFGCTDTSAQVFEVFPTIIANFTWSTPSGCVPLEVDFENTSQNATSFRWTFGMPGGSVNQNPTWFFEEPGDYSITLVVEGAGGCSDSITYSDIVTVWPNPIADFEFISIDEPVPAGIVLFNNTSTPHIDSFWNFGDGATGFGSPTTHQYDFFGSKLVTLAIVDANGCVDTIQRYISVDFFGTLHVPNAMSVNDPDPQVSVFLPKGRGLVAYRCMIFDKWGNRVWESTALEDGQPAEGWDGRYNGESVPQGAYVWKIDALFSNGSVWMGQEKNGRFYQSGTVTVIR
jgi:PKD repeat protein